ncbi:MAG: TIGR03790 family protein, partial [Verrucomicrobiota bacterium]
KYFRNEAGFSGLFLIFALRLDGPNPDIVKRIIDEAQMVDRYGFLGRGYFDIRNLPRGDYYAGEAWLIDAYGEMRNQGYEVTLDREPYLLTAYNPMEHTGFYMGWYTEHVDGAIARPDFRFRPGALAYHLHSASAKTLKSDKEQWVGPLLTKGAAFTFGAVYEPFLRYTVDLDILANRLRSGFTYAESVYMAMPAISWQMTVIGDPLARPFGYPLNQQIKHLEEDGRPEVEWAWLRQVNLMIQDGRFNRGMELCRRKMQETGSLVLREKLGDMYAVNNLFDAAIEQYHGVVTEAKTVETAVRVGGRRYRPRRNPGVVSCRAGDRSRRRDPARCLH